MPTMNKFLAVTPFETTQTKIEVKGGLVQIKQKEELTRLLVVYDAHDSPYQAGDAVWLRGEACKFPYAKHVFQIDEGKPFILVPFTDVMVHAKPER